MDLWALIDYHLSSSLIIILSIIESLTLIIMGHYHKSCLFLRQIMFPYHKSYWQQIMFASNRSCLLPTDHISHGDTGKSSEVFYGKGKGPHKNPYANPSSENLKHLPAHLLPETELENIFLRRHFLKSK